MWERLPNAETAAIPREESGNPRHWKIALSNYREGFSSVLLELYVACSYSINAAINLMNEALCNVKHYDLEVLDTYWLTYRAENLYTK